MSAQVPESVAENLLSLLLVRFLRRIHRGKVRDTYALPGHDDKLLVVATDRISIFDFVLGETIPFKGEVLTALTVFWLTKVFGTLVSFHHLIAHGNAIDAYLPKALRDNAALQRRALIVKKLEMLPIECIARGYLTGSGWRDYQKDGAICGIKLPPDLHDGSKLNPPLFTPSTKAEVGHDLPISADWVHGVHGSWVSDSTLSLYSTASEYALVRGVIIADTKLEFGRGGWLGDEVLTPDSSRFWDVNDYEAAQREQKSPAGYDKELVRQEGRKARINDLVVDISTLKPENGTDVALAASWRIPPDVVAETCARYLAIFERLTGMELAPFQQAVMHVDPLR